MQGHKKRKNIVAIGGGSGTFVVLQALKRYPVRLTAIISMADDGGSSGALRDQYGVLPPGDVRRALVALAESSAELRDLFNHRFKNGDLENHTFGNLFLTALEQQTGSFAKAVEEAGKILNIRGNVIPVTLNNVRLHARLADGKIVKGETNIDIPREKIRAPIERVWLVPAARVNPAAARAIRMADMIVIGPGDIYTSIVPNLLVRGVPEAIKKSRAKKVYVANLMTKFGETQDFRAEDFVSVVERYLGCGVVDAALFNSKRPAPSVLARYRRAQSAFVDARDLKNSKKPRSVLKDLLDGEPLLRHSETKLGKALYVLLQNLKPKT